MSIGGAVCKYISERTRDFTERRWVFARLQDWAQSEPGRYFLITDGPGTGKTAIAGMLVFRSLGLSPPDPHLYLGADIARNYIV